MKHVTDQVIALAGLFQSVYAVHDLAKDGHCELADLETATQSLFVTSPEHTLDVYGDAPAISNGLSALEEVMGNTHSKRQAEPLRYAMALMHLERQLAKDKTMLTTIGQRLEHAKTQRSHFGPDHANVYEGLASIYSDTISTLKLRIQVSGRQEHLQVPTNAAKIRTLLLAGIRAAMLWRQVGGHRWHLLLKKKSLLRTAHSLQG